MAGRPASSPPRARGWPVNEHCCPKCGGTDGYDFDMHVTHRMSACGWGPDDEPEAGGTDRNARGGSGVSLFTCRDCGAMFNEKTVRKVRGIDND